MGLLDDFLTSPLTQTLLPTALGAFGGALSSPLSAGRRGAIGSAIQGGAGGLAAGMQTMAEAPERQARMKMLEEQTKQLQQQEQLSAWSLADKKNQEAFAANIKDPNSQAMFRAQPDVWWANQKVESRKEANIHSLVLSGFPMPEAQLRQMDAQKLDDLAAKTLEARVPKTQQMAPHEVPTASGIDIIGMDASGKVTKTPTGEMPYQAPSQELYKFKNDAGKEVYGTAGEARGHEPGETGTLVPILDPKDPSKTILVPRELAVGATPGAKPESPEAKEKTEIARDNEVKGALKAAFPSNAITQKVEPDDTVTAIVPAFGGLSSKTYTTKVPHAYEYWNKTHGGEKGDGVGDEAAARKLLPPNVDPNKAQWARKNGKIVGYSTDGKTVTYF